MKLKQYPKYKESGIQWIGKIPEKWDVKKFSSFGLFISSGIDKNIKPNEPLVQMVNYTDIYGNDSLVIDPKKELMIVSCPRGKILPCGLKKGDIVFTPSSETEEDIGLSAVILEDLKNTVFSYHVIRFRPSIKIDLNYKKYIANNNFVLSQFSSICKGTTRQILTHDDFKNIIAILPSEKEQSSIASFLDKKTSELNILIEKDKKLIELLKEKRIALINHVVTKGLNPNAKMKDSEIEWIGKIPEGWKTIRGKFVFHVFGGYAFPSENFVEKGIKLIRIGDMSNETINLEDCKMLPIEYSKIKAQFRAFSGDILVAMTGATIGKISQVPLINEILLLNQRVGNIRSKQDKRFLFYILNANFIKKQIRLIAEGAAQENISSEQIQEFIIPLLNKEEQIQIATYLDKATSKIDITIQKIERKIELLEEYKKSLIHHAVTGKVDVGNEK